ncbi:AsmA family protein [Arenibaculum pallidiluteum]|uniref:AsmA family protein n=1 Tax=Arenibaculum pallidiluteum TaxID=2812559 RepID=UPI001A95A9DA|nr:AsmA family protein [Arenibaculum pallidiluteum]
MKKILTALIVVVVVVVAAAIAVPMLVPVEPSARALAASLGQRIGHEVALDGPIGLRVLPRPSIELQAVRVAGSNGGPDLARIGKVSVTLRPLPLLTGRIVVDELVLADPDIRLARDAGGRGNWEPQATAGRPAPGGSGTEPGAPSEPVEPAGAGGGPVFETIEIRNGRVEWTDAAAGTRHLAEAIQARGNWSGLSAPAAVEGTMTLDGRPMTVAASLGAGDPGSRPLTLSLKGGPATLAFDGTTDTSAPGLAGRIEVKAESLAAAGAWLGTGGQLPAEAASLAGRIEARRERVALAGAELALGPDRGRADLALALGGARPRLTGSLATGRVRLDRPVAPAGPPGPAPAADPAAGGAGGSAGAPAPATPVPPDQPIDMAPLRMLDAALDIAVEGVGGKGLDLGATKAKLTLEDGLLQLAVADTALHDGTIGGRIGLDGRRPMPAASLDLRFNGVQAGPLLAQAADFTALQGLASGTLSLRAEGSTRRAMLASLDGEGAAQLRDGSFRGIDLLQALQGAVAVLRGGAPSEGGERTDFADLGASWTIRDGILGTEDLSLKAPLLAASGRGTVDLPAATVDMRIEARTEGIDFAVPLQVRGPLAKPGVKPDLSGLAGQALGGRKPEEAVKGVLDGLSGGGKPIDALKGLLGR